MDAELKNYLEGKFSDVRSEFEAVRREIERTETRLLTEFWKWGRASDTRIRRVEHSDATTVERLASMEERLFTLELRVAGGNEL